jgi:hypothetical protein
MAKPVVTARPDAKAPGTLQQAMHRACLVCKRRFVSAWTGARICDDCRARSDAASTDRKNK